MNPGFMAAGYVHTIPEKLVEYFAKPFTNLFVIFVLVIMFANTYMFKKLWKIKAKDYMIVINIVTIGIYVFMAVISAVLVSRLGPHGNLKGDDCDLGYMFIPRICFYVVSAINILYFVINLFTKLKKDKYEQDTIKRGYFAEENEETGDEEGSEKLEDKKSNINLDISSIAKNIKDKIDLESVKDKVSEFTDNVRDLINKKNDRN